MQRNPADVSLVSELRRALRHLYDPVELRNSLLVEMLELAGQENPVFALRHMLVTAIEALKPDANTPAGSTAWRAYHILFQRYTEQFTQKDVATDLAISIRQLRREENRALQLLADHLRTHYRLHSDERMSNAVLSRSDSQADAADQGPSSREQELVWLQKSSPNETVDFGQMIQTALKTAAPMMQALGVSVQCRIAEDLPRLAVQLTTVQQALLNTLIAAVRSVPAGRVQVEAEACDVNVCVAISPIRPYATASSLETNGIESLEMARQLVGLSGGSLEVVLDQDKEHPFAARFVLPAAEQVIVLVIDDNVDTLRLLQRYLTGTRYRFIGVPDPDQALTLTEKTRPHVILLDIMLPRIDGWQLLGRLREHPKTRDVPVIICTILPQEQLALALGAAAFIRKPISRSALLAALDRQVGLPLKEFC